LEESELVQGLRERREDAVQAYLARYRSLFFHCIGHFEADPALREDLFQELSWHALERLARDSFDPERGSFGTWLYRVAWCRCVDLKRQQNARRRHQAAATGEELPDRPDPSSSPVQQAEEGEIEALVRSALNDLEPEERSLLSLRYVEERTLVEIAARLSITVEQAKYRLKRASAAMRRTLLHRMPRTEAVE